jgi:hypothetical protein
MASSIFTVKSGVLLVTYIILIQAVECTENIGYVKSMVW